MLYGAGVVRMLPFASYVKEPASASHVSLEEPAASLIELSLLLEPGIVYVRLSISDAVSR